MFKPFYIPNKNTRELRNNVNLASKKFNFSRFLDSLCFELKTLEKWEKNNQSGACPCRIEKSHPRGSEFYQGLGKPRPWLNFRPLG